MIKNNFEKYDNRKSKWNILPRRCEKYSNSLEGTHTTFSLSDDNQKQYLNSISEEPNMVIIKNEGSEIWNF